MSLLKSVTSAVKKLTGNVTKAVSKVANIMTGGVSGVAGGVGNILNDVTGQTSAGKVNQQYAKELAQLNQQYALESAAKSQQYAQANMKLQNQYEVNAAKNAHQWEVQDLIKAGLNPVLSAGGQGAQADGGLINASVSSGSGSAGSQGASGINIMDSLTSAGKTLKQISQIGAETENVGADTALKAAQTAGEIERNKYIAPEKKAQITNALSNATLNSAKTQSEATRRQEMRANAKYQNERARGFVDSTSYENGMSFLGSGSHGGVSHTKTR